MDKALTKQEMEALLVEQTNSILQAVDTKFARLEVRLLKEHNETNKAIQTLTAGLDEVRQSIKELTAGLDEVRRSIQELTSTLNQFIRRVEAQESKFEVLNAKIEKITSFIKEKFGVEIAV